MVRPKLLHEGGADDAAMEAGPGTKIADQRKGVGRPARRGPIPSLASDGARQMVLVLSSMEAGRCSRAHRVRVVDDDAAREGVSDSMVMRLSCGSP